MATIFFTSLGSFVGNAVGLPATFKFLGGRLGSYVSQRILKSEKFRSISSPRLDDLFLQTSAYGRQIPICFGNFRFGGNIIWALPINEVLSTDLINFGGGGGFIKGIIGGTYTPGTTIEKKTYNYYTTLAIGICEGEVDSLVRIWADGTILDLTKLKYRFYRGSEDQIPDSMISADVGIENAPGFRGLCYIVIEDFHINPYGNRIPNFTFEVKRALKNEESLEFKIDSVNLIPGSGEFVYDTRLIFKKEANYFDGSGFVLSEERAAINNFSENSLEADAIIGLEQLKEDLPNVKWVNVVVSWFVSSLDLRDIKLYPAVEFRDIINETEDGFEEFWNVAGLRREKARVIGRNPSDPSKPNYGGTPSDRSLARYLTELKKRGYKILLYPMIFVDRADKPWRGFISGEASDLQNFFKGQNSGSLQNTFNYFDFILHYAKNFASEIDGIIIGSELKGITKISVDGPEQGSKEFPAVNFLKELASKVKNEVFSIFPENKFVLYAADWSEYHSESGWFYMDELHADPNIDFVGIDAYFPLTDSENLNFIPSKDQIKEGFESGEGYEYYYSYDEDGSRVRIPFDGPTYAWKNILHWWGSEHFNPDGKKTSWVPKMKKIWFTEFGFPSLHGASNTPNIFYNPESSSGGLPAFSNGTINNDLQALCIEGTIEYWAEQNEKHDIIERLSLWCYDARPYPYYPLNLDAWADGGLWGPGHWVNGKLGVPLISDIIKDLLERVDFWFLKKKPSDEFFKSDIYIRLDGFAAGNSGQTIRDLIYSLQDFYPFDIVESEESAGRVFLNFLSKSNKKPVLKLNFDEDLLICDQEKILPIENSGQQKGNIAKIKTNINYENLSSSVSLSYFSKEAGFETRVLNFSLDDIDLE